MNHWKEVSLVTMTDLFDVINFCVYNVFYLEFSHLC